MNKQQRVVNATRDWVEQVVIGYNFCPFARPVFEPDLIRYVVEDSTQVADVLEAVYQACVALQANERYTTTLVIFYRCGVDFDDYLDILAMAEQLISSGGFSGEFQLASFHPDYVFDGEEEGDASHYTNRSPYPVLHVIRERDIEKAMKSKEDASAIYERNMRKANQLGCAHFDAILQDIKASHS